MRVGGQALAWGSAFVFGTAFTGIIASIAARVSDNLSGDEFGAAYGVATILFGLGLAAGPQLGGATADWFDSFGPAFGLAVAACVAGIALTGWGDDPPRGQLNSGSSHQGKYSGRSWVGRSVNSGGRFSRKEATPSCASAPRPRW